ncbi:hypothetical protein MNBD_GAMMA07-1988 [hydrothermal vent metagenome]|uniref:Putative DNA-binding domain-containing protein n=1 Tax=hydrothermal vent metagenome TaxID=652676 RepID=A0A3B0WIE6_9ZZZZ
MTHAVNPDTAQLADMQQWMFDALVFPRQVEQTQIKQRLVASPTQNAAARLSIYQHAYILRLCKCLEDQFPALCHALGKPLFNDFTCEYLRAYPSNSYTLYELGMRFTDFLKENRPDKNQASREVWIDFILNLAHYEYELFRLFDAPGNEGKTWPCATISDEHLILQPCFSIASYNFPVAAYYHQVRDATNPSLPPKQNAYVAISRKDYITSSFPVNYVHYLFLTTLRDCENISQSIDQVAHTLKRSVTDVKHSWQNDVRQVWLNSGFFVDKREVCGII